MKNLTSHCNYHPPGGDLHNKFETRIPNYIYIFKVARKGWGVSVPMGSLADQGPFFPLSWEPFFLTRKFTAKIHCIFHFYKLKMFITNNVWDLFHVTFSDLPKLRSQEKGVLAKGGFCKVQCYAQKNGNTKDIGPSSSFGTQSTTAKRGMHFYQNPLPIAKALKGYLEKGGFDAKGSIEPFRRL